jgi:hypothetical protein
MPKVSFRMASASRESVFGVQTNTARKIHPSDHTEGRLTTAPSGCCERKGTLSETVRCTSPSGLTGEVCLTAQPQLVATEWSARPSCPGALTVWLGASTSHWIFVMTRKQLHANLDSHSQMGGSRRNHEARNV